jgi:hypothetical protein
MLGDFQRSLGLEIAGAKNDRTALAVVDFYPKTRRLVVSDVEPKLKGHHIVSADEALLDSVAESHKTAGVFTGIGIHGPISLPPAFMQKRDSEIRWMNDTWKRIKPHPRPFVPYLQRSAEIWLRYLTPEKFLISDGMGSNSAPHTARLQFLTPQLPGPLHEVFPRATMSRLISSLGLPKALTRNYTDFDKGLSAREDFFEAIGKKLPQVFIYERDLDKMITSINCFNAFLCALTQHLIYRKQCEVAPRGFPRGAAWIHIPRPDVHWDQAFK